MVSQIEAGKVKVLALTTAHRSPRLPNVPTFDEAGFGAYPGRPDLLGRRRAYRHAGADRHAAARRIAGDFSKREIHRLRQSEFSRTGRRLRPADFAAFLKKDRKDAAVLVDKYMK